MKKVIFDTSAINGLAEDSDAVAIIKSLGVAYRVGITVTALTEVVATTDERIRRKLLDLLKLLLTCGQCVMHFYWIIEKHAKVYKQNPNAYGWRKVKVRYEVAEREIVRQKFVHTTSDETRQENREAEREFRNTFASAKPALDKVFETGRERPSLEEVTRVLVAEGGAYFITAANLVERATGSRPTNIETKDFVERCPPFKALIMALCVSQYDIGIRAENTVSLGKAGRVDMFSAVFLPYCEIFVTRDPGQCKALKQVAKLMDLETSITMYEDFKRGLLGFVN
jgi:hypothetical protein